MEKISNQTFVLNITNNDDYHSLNIDNLMEPTSVIIYKATCEDTYNFTEENQGKHTKVQ